MFSFDGLTWLNQKLTGFYRIIYLGILWLVVTLAGLVVVGIGPASYALCAYLDRWFRLGEQPPMTRTFFRYAREQGRRPVLVGLVLLGASAVIAVNLMSLTNWYLRAANLAVLAALVLIAAYVFFVMTAMDVPRLRDVLSAALLVGFGSLHWSIIVATVTGVIVWVVLRFAAPLLPLCGVSIPAAMIALVVRPVFRKLQADAPPSAAHPSDNVASDALPKGTFA
jgi:uncharacterized membrane protein YesL